LLLTPTKEIVSFFQLLFEVNNRDALLHSTDAILCRPARCL
jgi:hypothetical protein